MKKPQDVSITRIVSDESKVYGLGSDQKMYRWSYYNNGEWEPMYYPPNQPKAEIIYHDAQVPFTNNDSGF